ncbi:MAG TPA: tryptophan--tRNA ligase, partial [Acidimicrobiales bacterium]|nr:tryptophan--tRNA ligase [Acidimicrobiales bacterium]
AVIPPAGARVMDLQDPSSKMSKSEDSPQGSISLLDDEKTIEKKIKRAVTDSDGDVFFDTANKPGVSNLLSILGAATGQNPKDAGKGLSNYGELKGATAESVIEMLRPIQNRYYELANDPSETNRLLMLGADKAREIASTTLDRAKNNLGLLPR